MPVDAGSVVVGQLDGLRKTSVPDDTVRCLANELTMLAIYVKFPCTCSDENCVLHSDGIAVAGAVF